MFIRRRSLIELSGKHVLYNAGCESAMKSLLTIPRRRRSQRRFDSPMEKA